MCLSKNISLVYADIFKYPTVGKFPMGGMHEVAEFSPIDSTALAVLRLAQTDRRFTVFHACNSHHIYA